MQVSLAILIAAQVRVLSTVVGQVIVAHTRERIQLSGTSTQTVRTTSLRAGTRCCGEGDREGKSGNQIRWRYGRSKLDRGTSESRCRHRRLESGRCTGKT